MFSMYMYIYPRELDQYTSSSASLTDLKFRFPNSGTVEVVSLSLVDSDIALRGRLPHLHLGDCSTVVGLIDTEPLDEGVFRKLNLSG